MARDTEADKAAYYEAHKDDAEEWGAPEAAPARPRRRLASMISVRLSPSEADKIRQAAETQGMSVSAFLRAAALHLAMRSSTPPAPSSLPPLDTVRTRIGTTRTLQADVSVRSAPSAADVSKIGEAHATSTSAA